MRFGGWAGWRVDAFRAYWVVRRGGVGRVGDASVGLGGIWVVFVCYDGGVVDGAGKKSVKIWGPAICPGSAAYSVGQCECKLKLSTVLAEHLPHVSCKHTLLCRLAPETNKRLSVFCTIQLHRGDNARNLPGSLRGASYSARPASIVCINRSRKVNRLPDLVSPCQSRIPISGNGEPVLGAQVHRLSSLDGVACDQAAESSQFDLAREHPAREHEQRGLRSSARRNSAGLLCRRHAFRGRPCTRLRGLD